MKIRTLQVLVVLMVLALAGTLVAQGGPEPGAGPGRPGMHRMASGGRMGPMDRWGAGAWWKNSEVVQKLGLTDEQVQKIDKAFQDHRMQLVDLRAALEKEELKLKPLMESDNPNEGQVTAQIEKIAQARASLEKSNALMLLGVRKVLTVDQWKQLQAARSNLQMRPRAHRSGPPPTTPAPPVQ